MNTIVDCPKGVWTKVAEADSIITVDTYETQYVRHTDSVGEPDGTAYSILPPKQKHFWAKVEGDLWIYPLHADVTVYVEGV